MKKLNQKGFSVVEGFLILVVVGIVGFVGWYVWQNNKTNKPNDNSRTVNNSPKTSKPVNSSAVFSKLPSNFSEFKIDEYGFRMGYPNDAGKMEVARKGGVLYVARTPEAYDAKHNWLNGFQLNIFDKSDFTFSTGKYGATLKPENGKWIVTEKNSAVEDYKIGDVYKMPEKKFKVASPMNSPMKMKVTLQLSGL